MADRVLISVHVFVPALALGNIAHFELPALRRFIEPREETITLLLLGHVQEEFQDQRAVARQMTLEVPDARVALVPDILAEDSFGQMLPPDDFRTHARHEHFLVMRAVEDPDAAAFGQRLGDTPEKIVIKLLLTRLLEG